LAAGTCANPVVVLANYAFDTFRQDIFRVEGGKVHEVGVTTGVPQSGPVDLGQPDLMGKLRTQYRQREIDETRYYEDPLYNQILADYRSLLAEASFTVPVAGLGALERLLALSGGRGLLLSSDKGFSHIDELYSRNPEAMQLHTGCFS